MDIVVTRRCVIVSYLTLRNQGVLVAFGELFYTNVWCAELGSLCVVGPAYEQALDSYYCRDNCCHGYNLLSVLYTEIHYSYGVIRVGHCGTAIHHIFSAAGGDLQGIRIRRHQCVYCRSGGACCLTFTGLQPDVQNESA